jgi:hypothetical protein
MMRALAFACALSACAEAPAAEVSPNYLTREQLLDPEQCKSCHPQQYREWASSMHAYAAEDPVFIAMNRRGQRETAGALGEFCVKCHAPMALAERATLDGMNLADVPAPLKGVTCYVCHNAIDTGDHFNNDLTLADDTTMRAAITDPIQSPAHATAYGALQDSNRRESSQLCGTCHDVVVPSGVHLERTFAEYQASLFGQLEEGFETCPGCHMPGREGHAAVLPNAPQRVVHAHLWPAVDVALTDFPDRELQRRAVECELALGTRIRSVEHDGLGTFTVLTETAAGHKQPSGAAQDRRMWIEVVAYDAEERVVFESGHIADADLIERTEDPQLVLYRDWMYDADGAPTHNFWEAAASTEHPNGYESLTLPFAVDPLLPHSLSARYSIARHAEIARMTIRLRMQPIGNDALADLVASGDLDEAVPSRMPTFTMHGAAVEWRPDEPTPRSLLPRDLGCIAP